MKKYFKLFTVLSIVSLISVGKVYATDLTSQITVNDSLDITTVEKSYDATNDVNEMKITVTANEEIISKVLSHVAGNNNSPALLGRYYFEFNPNLDGTGLTFKKNNKEYTGTLADGIAAVKPTIAGETAVNYSRVWLVALNVQYYDAATTTWKDITNTSTGGKSVGKNLSELLGVPESQLKYGENFRFYMPEGTSKIYGWEIFENGESTNKYEYLNVTYELKFPITGIIDDRGYYFTDLQEAVESGSTEVIINEDLTLDNDVRIPADVTVELAEGATLTIPRGVTLTVDEDADLTGLGLIEKEGSLLYGNEEIFFINVKDSENGKVAVDVTAGIKDARITITTTPNENYKLKTLKVVNLSTNKEIEVVDGKFVMPDSDVEISAEFEAVESKELPPKTSDINLALILGTMLVASVGVVLTVKKIKNR